MFCACSGLVGWLCQLPFLFPGVLSMSNTPRITSNLGETSRNGIPLGSFLEVFPALHFFFLFLQSSFQQEACVYVWLSLVLSCFVHVLGWLGGCVSCRFCFQGFRACRIPFKIISHLGEIPRNGIPLGSFLGVFPALHFSFLFLQSSFQQEGCVYVWLSLVLSCFVHVLGWLGGCVSCLFCFQGFRACRIPLKIISNLGETSRNGIPLGSLLEVFPALDFFPFYFFHFLLARSMCVCLVVPGFVMLSIFWAGWVVCAKWHSTGLSPGSVPSLAFFLSISSIFFSARSMRVCLVVIEFVMLSIFWAGWVVVSAAFLVSRGSEHVEYPENNFKLGGNLHGMAFHWALSWKCSQPWILPFYFFNLLFSKKHVFMFGCHWFCHVFCIFGAGWVVVSAAFLFPGVPSMSNTLQNNLTFGGNPTEWHSTGLFSGSVPSLAFFFSISSIFFSARRMCLCLVVTGFVMFYAFSGLVG